MNPKFDFERTESNGLVLVSKVEAVLRIRDAYEAGRASVADRGVQAVPGEPVAYPTLWPAARDVLFERRRQVSEEGRTPKHDDKHASGSLALAAACYACNAATWSERCISIPDGDYMKLSAPGFRWPWANKWWKPKSQREDLVRAGALILAEIERLDRKEQRS